MKLHGVNHFIHWSPLLSEVISGAENFVKQTKVLGCTPTNFLIEGSHGSGKTSLALKMAGVLGHTCIKICSAEGMIGLPEMAKCSAIKQVFDDASQCERSCIIIDDIERIIGYVSIGPRFSKAVLETIRLCLQNQKKGLIVGTTSCKTVMQDMGIIEAFQLVLHVPNISSGEELVKMLEVRKIFEADELQTIRCSLREQSVCISVKKLIALSGMAAQAHPSVRVKKFISLLDKEEFDKGFESSTRRFASQMNNV